MSRGLFILIYTPLFICVTLLSYYFNGSVYVANDELKFSLIASGEINYTLDKILRTTSDFYMYYKSGSFLFECFGLSPAVFYKVTSFISGLICFFSLINIANRFDIDIKFVFLSALSPIVLFFFFSGVRDSWITLLYIVFLSLALANKNFYLILIVVAIYFVRPESLIPIAIYFFLRIKFPEKKIIYSFTLVSLILLMFLISELIPHLNSEGGMTGEIRKLPVIAQLIFLGALNLMGGFPHPSLLELSSAREFIEHGYYYKNESFAIAKTLKLVGVYIQTAIFPVVVLLFLRKVKMKLDGQVSKLDDFFIASVMSVVLFGFFSIEQGKVSSFLLVINLLSFHYLYYNFWKLIPYVMIFILISIGASFYVFI